MLRNDPSAFGADYESALQLTERHFQERTHYVEDNFIIGAFAADALLGSCGARRDSGVKRQHIGYIWGMYLSIQHRGTGTAAALLAAAIEGLKKLPGLELIQLAVTTGNRAAEQLYVNAGFQEYGVEPAALKVDGTNYDERLMWLPIR
jgi:RimJ/RimL family protein N-acetyltransferase